ncbi:PilX N-terminal domain-containing pilus assembly protein [Pseudomonas sp. HR96]|uniref:pilus assembly PilX family protein n=1 Tax=Pseudomonas sp. HR96 TaxID=1027966 RepID=UPI002A755AF5|nr:PilX N-terminal domain-containing pilus assembly protein [Pseudomonas sp. HR96]WPO99330.1 PilX N-terminal domain-containing pilus assembly protein [Pseudomonas sp. HR96]
MSRRYYRQPQLSCRQQSGLVLVVALIFLLLVTLIGVSSMQNATMQEKMAGSVTLKNLSFQLAEATLRVGENAVASSTYKLTQCSGAAACLPPPDSTSTTLSAGTGTNGVLWIANSTGDGFYGVQNIGTTSDAVNAPANCAASATLYRITAVGISGISRTVLESVYAKCT